MKKLLLLGLVLFIAPPAYGSVNLGTSTSATSPQVTGDATTGLFSSTADAVSISSGGTEIMRVNGTGVGIGTTSPLVSLDIAGNAWVVSATQYTGIGVFNSSSNPVVKIIGATSSNDDGQLFLFNGGNEGVFLEANGPSYINGGEVGIGTTSPAYQLDVRGTAGSTLASNSLPVINKVHVQTFTSSGTYTPSTGMVYALIEVIGAGGGGGGAGAGIGEAGPAGGGGGGAYARGLKTAATIGSSQTVTVGAGGSGGAAGVNNGSAGGSSSVGSLISAGAGSYGVGGTPSSGIGNTNGSNGAGAPGGTYDYGVSGQDGWLGIGFGIECVSGFGGSSGSGSPGGYQVPHSAAGTAATGYGGGGSGGCTENTTTTQAGGAGAPGLVVITEYISD